MRVVGGILLLSLSLGNRRWQGAPPPGEENQTTLMLLIGTTFR